uniref:nuclear receptor subfamily 1 group I member 3-like n=1 Tax=Styela clava TaxID=7725 RepID=UPI0019394061|nr:nuclear receptor subfamily 1 group I member 3-like [Styela clava]
MMVASTSMIKLDPTHRYNPSLPEMEYHHIRPLNNDQNSVFTSQSSYDPVNDTRFVPVSVTETYKEYYSSPANGSEDNNRPYSMSTGTETFYSDSRNSDSNSPPERKLIMQDEGQHTQMTNSQLSNKTYGCTRSPTQLSPPPKRFIERSSPAKMQCDMPMQNASITKTDLQTYNDPRYASPFVNPPNHCFETKPIINPSDTSGIVGYTSTISANPDFYKSSYMVSKESDVNENEVITYTSLSSTNDERHFSHSSTNSSTSSSYTPKPTTPSRPPSQKPMKTPTKLQQQHQVPNFFFDDDDDDSWKICQVCADKATGYHFNALTCEGCKGFFRRSMKNSKNFTCPYTGNCTITKSNRRQCQACRLDKCLRIGMKKECIMSHSEIQMKKNLMLNNRIKKNIILWKPSDYTPEKRSLVELITTSHCQTNNPPNISEEGIVLEEKNPNASPASSTGSGFSELIDRMTQDIVATAPGQAGASKAHLQHFSAIMEFSIKEIIKFCKKIPGFISLSLKDQITLLKSGCTEILFIKANYTYDRKQNALMCGPGKYYTRESFILGGMSEEYTDCYLQFHHKLSHMGLDDTELACICASTLFSSDRDELENREAVEAQQEIIVSALQAYSENTYHCQIRFPKIMAYLTRLRTLNWHISKTHGRLENTDAAEAIQPLVLEVTPSV